MVGGMMVRTGRPAASHTRGAVEPSPKLTPQNAIVEKNGLCVVRLVRERNEQGLGRLGRQFRQIGFLTWLPFWFGLIPGIRAIRHDFGDGVAEPCPDLLQRFCTTLILGASIARFIVIGCTVSKKRRSRCPWRRSRGCARRNSGAGELARAFHWPRQPQFD
jgi:hypothetical protein